MQLIKEVNYTNFLGLYIDENFSWKYHISHVTMKMSKMTGILANAIHSKPLKCYTWRWSTHWYLTYCNITWASTYPTRLNPILKTQKKLIRIMTFSRFTEKSAPLFKSLKILNIFELNAYLTAVFMYSHHHEKLPAFLDNLFKTNKSVHSCNTRSAANIHKKNKLWQIFRL